MLVKPWAASCVGVGRTLGCRLCWVNGNVYLCSAKVWLQLWRLQQCSTVFTAVLMQTPSVSKGDWNLLKWSRWWLLVFFAGRFLSFRFFFCHLSPDFDCPLWWTRQTLHGSLAVHHYVCLLLYIIIYTCPTVHHYIICVSCCTSLHLFPAQCYTSYICTSLHASSAVLLYLLGLFDLCVCEYECMHMCMCVWAWVIGDREKMCEIWIYIHTKQLVVLLIRNDQCWYCWYGIFQIFFSETFYARCIGQWLVSHGLKVDSMSCRSSYVLNTNHNEWTVPEHVHHSRMTAQSLQKAVEVQLEIHFYPHH